MNKKKLTMIVPVYNTETYLIRCFDSLIHPDIKVIAVNDGSTDGSRYIIKNYFEKYPDHFTSIETLNKGAVHARRLALKYVDTPYFGYCDSDDFINTEAMVDLCKNMQKNNFKIGNGRMTVYMPGTKIPFHSRKWKLEKIDFETNRPALSNTTVSLLDKIFHSDLLSYFDVQSDKKVYEDMEIVYYILVKYGRMLHTNNKVYNYCMRTSEQGSSSALGLDMLKVDGLKGLISSSQSVKDRLKKIGLYEKYQDELTAIDIKLLYQRIVSIIRNPKIENKKELINIILSILDQFSPMWQTNPYYLQKFQGSEWNDYIFYIVGDKYMKFHNIYNYKRQQDKNVDELFNLYEDKILKLEKV